MNPWRELSQQFEDGDKENAIKGARSHLQNPSSEDWDWLSDALKDNKAKWFVAAVLRRYPVPKRLVVPFLQAAINESNPSFNRQFVEPVIESYGHRKVNEYLLDVVEGDDNEAIAGAVAALYWANMPLSYSGKVPEYTIEYASPESRNRFLELRDVWERKRQTYLRVFVSNQDVGVRRQIIPSLNVDENKYDDDLKPLVQEAIDIAKSHPDEYIRHRVEVQLGNEKLLRPLPEHTTENKS